MPGLLDDPILKDYRRQQTFAMLGRIGQGLLQAAGGGQGTLPGLAFGLNQAVGPAESPLAMLRLRREIEAGRDREKRNTAYSELLGGQPMGAPQAMEQAGIEGARPGPTPQAAGLLGQSAPSNPMLEGMNPQQMGLLRAAGPELGIPWMLKRQAEKPDTTYETVQNPLGLGGVGRMSSEGKLSNYRPKEKPPTPLAIERKMKLAGIDPQSEEGQKYIRADLAGQEITFEQGPEGLKVRIGKGPGQDSGLERKTRGNIEGELFKAREGMARLETIAAGFKPEYQQFDTRLGMAWTAFKDKFGSLPGIPDSVDPQTAELLKEFTLYRRDAIDNISKYIKDITGAAMAIPEAKRIRKGMPDPGEGIIDGDSPIEFQAKLLGTMRSLKLASARYSHALRNGMDWRDIDLSEVEEIMRGRMQELEQEVRARNPGIGQGALDRLLSHTLGVEFGLLGAE